MDAAKTKLLEERIDTFVEDEVEAALIQILPIRAQLVNNSQRFIQENLKLQDHFKVAAARMAWIIYQAAGNDGPARQLLEKGTNKLAKRLGDHMSQQRNAERGMQGTAVAMQGQLEERLARHARTACFDFGNGIAGEQVLKKGSDINVTNIMHDSPSGTQQAGVGQPTQSVTQNVYGSLSNEIDKMLSGSDFQALDPDKQTELSDIAEIVKDEAQKRNPDKSKLSRWGERLTAKATEFGLNTAAGVLSSILAQVISGG